MDDSDDNAGNLDLTPCRVCGRTFRQDVLSRHEPICKKSTVQKKRRVFESGKQRATGSDIPLSKVIKPNQPPPKDPPKVAAAASRKNNWRQRHEEFIRNIRAARQYQNASDAGGPLPPPPPPSLNPDFVQCDYCGRRFNEKAAERHIPFCREKNARVSGPGRMPAKANPYNTSDAKQKMAVRTQYQPPRPKLARGGAGGAPGSRGPSAGRPAPDQERTPSGAPLRTGKTIKDYMDARELADQSRNNSGGAGGRSGGGGFRQSPVRGTGYGGRGGGGGGGGGSNGSSGYSRQPAPAYGARGGSGFGGGGGGGGDGGEGGGMSKFCHECGNKYPIGAAKFCVECGCRRMTVG